MLSTPVPRHYVGSRRSLALVVILLGMAVSFTARVGAQQPAQEGNARAGTPTTAAAAPSSTASTVPAPVALATPAVSAIPRPAELQRDVNFWIRIYTEITTNEGLLHDEWAACEVRREDGRLQVRIVLPAP